MGTRTKTAIIGSGNIGTDLMIKIIKLSDQIELAAMVGIDAASQGLTLAKELGIATVDTGIDGLLSMAEFSSIEIVFDATSAKAHILHEEILRHHGKQVIDLTPAAVGPFTVPVVNLASSSNSANVNMVTCGGQATIPIVAAVGEVAPVIYAEIVASIASKSAGPGTRANIDEFTETTSRAIETVGGARRGKAIIVLNPAEPPLKMRDTIYCLADTTDAQAIVESVEKMVSRIQEYVPGYRLKQAILTEPVPRNAPIVMEDGTRFSGIKVSVFVEVEGAAHFLPAYAGNLDIMTSAALRTAEYLATKPERSTG